MMDRFSKEPEHVFNKFPEHHMKILLEFNAQVGREDILKPIIWNESLHKINNDNGVRVVNFATSKNLTVKSTMFPHHTIHKFTLTPADEKTPSQIDHILLETRLHSSMLDVQFFRAADCDTDHYLVVAKVRERLAVSKLHTEFIWSIRDVLKTNIQEKKRAAKRIQRWSSKYVTQQQKNNDVLESTEDKRTVQWSPRPSKGCLIMAHVQPKHSAN
jgi:hypothetical protein